MRKLGIVTVGQAPRVDVTPDLMSLLGRGIVLVECGALDGMDDFAALAPADGEAVLASRLADGGSVVVSEAKVIPLLQRAVDRTVAAGVEGIVVLCTAMPESAITASVPLVFPQVVLHDAVAARTTEHVAGAVDGDADGCAIAVLVPDEAQVASMSAYWEAVTGRKPEIYAATPYGPSDNRQAAAEAIADTDAACVVLDCIGYSVAMGDEIAHISGKDVVVPRALIARAALDALGE